MKKRYIADFETSFLTDEQIANKERVYVWAWALCNCDDYSIQTGTSIKTFFDTIQTIGNAEVWFHNLKFDFQFILSYMLEHNFKQVESNKYMKTFEFSSLVSVNETYSCEVKFPNNKILFLDSYKKLPFKVEKIAKDLKMSVQKGSIDYKAKREEGGILSEQDEDYIKRDVLIIAKAMNQIFFMTGYTKRTIGSDCLEFYRKIQPKFFSFFPKLSKEIIEFIQPAYAGGVCIVNKKKRGKILENGKDFDMNTMYGFVMDSSSGYMFPIGQPVKFKGGYVKDAKFPFYIQRLRCSFKLLEGKQPCIHTTLNGLYRQQEYVEDTKGDIVELTLCNYDLQLLFEHYDVQNIQLLGGYKFQATRGAFDAYIQYWYDIKRKAKIAGNDVEYLTSKLFLNNLGGKFAQGAIASNQLFSLDENGIITRKNKTFEKDTLYLPVAIAMTSAARVELFKAIDAAGDAFVYADTDSCKIDDVNLELPIRVDDFELGCWKQEAIWQKAIFVRPKTYAEFINGKWKITGAGMNDAVKDNVIESIEQDINSFKIGAEFSGKLATKHVPGGVVLTETTFEIRA